MICSNSLRCVACLLAFLLAAAGAAHASDPVGEAMAGEFALQSGELGEAARYYLDAARVSDDPGVAERAARIAVLAGRGAPADAALARWRELAPASPALAGVSLAWALEGGDVEAGIDYARTLLADDAPADYALLLSTLGDARDDAAITARGVLRGVFEQDRLPSTLGGWLAAAGLARRLDDRALSEEVVSRGLERFPEDPRAYLLRASRLREQGRDEEARAQLAALGDPGRLAPELRQAAARQFALLGDRLAAATALGRGAQDDGSLRQRARWLIEAGERAPIAALYLEAVQPRPGPERRFLLGLLAEALMRWQEAETWYASVPRGAGHDQAMLRLAGARGRLGKIEEALGTLHELQLDQAAGDEYVRDSYLLEAELLERRGRADEALATFGRALEMFEADPRLLYGRAMLHERGGRIGEALADLQAILDDDADNAQVLNAYGYALAVHRGRWREALPYVERALALQPDSPAILDSVGWIRFRLGQRDMALELLRRAWALRRDAEVAAHLGEVLWASGLEAEARETWRAGQRIDPDHPALKAALEAHP